MPEREKGTVKNPSLALIAFKPRQVLLAEQHQKQSSSSSNKPTFMAVMEKKQQHSEKTLAPEHNIQLLNSVLKYLESNHFSKSLKRLLKESQIQGDSWKASALDLADIYYKYLENCNHVDAKLANHKELEMQSDELGQHGNAAASQETISKKKTVEKDNSENIDSHKDTLSEVKLKKQKKKDKNKLTSESLDRDAKQSDLTEEKLKNDNGEIDFKENAKSKDKKKKNKSSTEPIIEDQKLNESKNSTTLVDDKSNTEIPLEESEVKPKEKKKKKEKKEKKSSVTSENGIDDYNGTKKRKRSTSHENESQPIEVPVPEETKRRKIEGLQEAKNVGQKVTTDKLPRGEGQGGKESEEENGKVNINEGEKSSIDRIGENTNGNTKNGVEKSGQRKQRNGSAEPKTVNAFQRVKVDEVQFVDERLQDNSYWAKDGAEIGYGAKAQEILGQVRGRDFRHEKTKKKRGSYRGGQIDLQSHSIKFNYSDEE